jgi:hypothetical protein
MPSTKVLPSDAPSVAKAGPMQFRITRFRQKCRRINAMDSGSRKSCFCYRERRVEGLIVCSICSE